MIFGGIIGTTSLTPVDIEQFASDGGTFPIYGQATWPAGFRDSANDVTYLMREAYLGGFRIHRVVSYDHGTSTWGNEYTCGTSNLVDNDHGVPTGFRDGDGYIHWFGGAHGTALYHTRTVAADDISAWTGYGQVGANDYTYPHPVYDGTDLYLFLRKKVSSSPQRRTLVVLPSTSISSGSITFGTEESLADFGDDSRIYTGWVHDDGTDVHLFCTRAPGDDSFRRDVYHFRYEKSTGDLKNNDGTRTDSSLPISKATADTHYRIVAQTNDTSMIAGCLDANGDMNLAYIDGSGASWTIQHMVRSGGAWGTPTTAASFSGDRVCLPCLVPLSNGNVELYYPEDVAAEFSRNGSVIKRAVYNGSNWSAAQTELTKAGSKALGEPSQIYNASEELRLTVHENTQDSLDASAGSSRSYAIGTGVASRTIPTVDDEVVLQLSFDGADAATATYDESIYQPFRGVSFFGNAQLDTAQKKFGASSLLLDGSGDYLTVPYTSLLDAAEAADKTYEAWVRVSAFDTGDHQTIMDTRGAVTLSNRGIQFAILNSTKQVFFNGYNSSGGVAISLVGTTALVAGTTYHVAATREGTTWRIFVNGALENSGTQSGSIAASGEGFNIGRSGSAAAVRYFKGHIDELRVIHGRPEYTAAFTPPTAAFDRP